MPRTEAAPALRTGASNDVVLSSIGALTIGAAGVFFVLARSSAATGGFFRCALALPLLAALAQQESGASRPDRRATGFLVAAGLLFAADLVVWHQAILEIGAGLGTALAHTQLIFVTVIATVFLRERIPARSLAGIPISIAGVVLVSGALEPTPFGDNPERGAALGLLAGLLYATFVVLLRRGQSVPGRSATTLLVSTGTAAVALAGFGAVTGEVDFTPSPRPIAWLACLALASQVVAWMLISRSLPRLPAVTTSAVLTLQPLAALASAAVVLGEEPSSSQCAGVVALLLGFAVVRRRPAADTIVT